MLRMIASPRPLLTRWFGVSRSGPASSWESSDVTDEAALLGTGELDSDRRSGVSSVVLSSTSLELTCFLKGLLGAEPPEDLVGSAIT